MYYEAATDQDLENILHAFVIGTDGDKAVPRYCSDLKETIKLLKKKPESSLNIIPEKDCVTVSFCSESNGAEIECEYISENTSRAAVIAFIKGLKLELDE